MIRKPGYHGQEITLALDRDVKTVLKLEKLGPDDVVEMDNCEER
jgi:hypothetical protein